MKTERIKRYAFTFIVLTSMTIGSFMSCSPDEKIEPPKPENSYLKVSVDSILLSENTTEASFTVVSNVEWTISGQPTWLEVTPTSGKDETKVKLNAIGIEAGGYRTTELHIEGGNIIKRLKVSQKGLPKKILSVSSESLYFTNKKSSQYVELTSEGRWEISSNTNWCTCDKTTGSYNARLTISVDENTSSAERQAVVAIKTEYSLIEISVTQEAGALFEVSPNVLTFDCYSRLTGIVNVVAEGWWTVGSDANWCTVSYTSEYGSKEKEIYIAEGNLSSISRKAILTFTRGEQKRIVTVVQNAYQPPLVTSFEITKKNYDGFDYSLSCKSAESYPEIGVCYSTTNMMPTIKDESQRGGLSRGTAKSLQAGIEYYVRAYVKDAAEISYSDVLIVSFGYPENDDITLPSFSKKK